MKLGSKIKTADYSGGMVNEEESDFAYDLRLVRRWKRRGMKFQNLRLNSCTGEASKKTISKSNKNNESKVMDVDSDYKKFLDDIVQFVDADSSVGMIKAKDSDLAYDFRLARQCKRRCITSEDLWLDSCSNKASKKNIKWKTKNNKDPVEAVMVDSDYQKYLDDMVQFVDVDNDGSCAANVNDGNVCEVLDAHYVMFLDNLKVDGNSYVLELALSNDKSVIVKYEENGLDNELDMKNLATLKASQNIENIEAGNSLISRLERENFDSPLRILKSNSGREKIENPIKVSRDSVRQKVGRSKTVLKSSSRWRKTETTRKSLMSGSKREDNENPSVLNDAVKREKNESLRTLGNGLSRERMGTRKKFRDVWTIDKRSPAVERDVKMETENHVSSEANGCSRKRHCVDVKVTHSAKKRCNFKQSLKSDFVDESYQINMNSVKKEDQHFVYSPHGGNRMVYFRDEESDSDLIVVDDPFLMGNRNPFVSSEYGPCVDLDAEGCTEPKGSHFREKLLEILQKPYDKTEYYRLQIDSRLYLPQFKDLTGKICQARRDKPQILNLLRGFFYWVQYLNSEGAFTPWLDPQCLNILPPH